MVCFDKLNNEASRIVILLLSNLSGSHLETPHSPRALKNPRYPRRLKHDNHLQRPRNLAILSHLLLYQEIHKLLLLHRPLLEHESSDKS